MTFESIIGVFCPRQVYFKELKIQLNKLNLKHGVQMSHSGDCSLKKKTTNNKVYIFCFQMSCVVFF